MISSIRGAGEVLLDVRDDDLPAAQTFNGNSGLIATEGDMLDGHLRVVAFRAAHALGLLG